MEESIQRKKAADMTSVTGHEEDAGAIILARARRLIASTPMSGDFTANALWGWEFRQKLAQGQEFFILDIREREDYEKGHIEGSVHAEFRDWAQPGTLEMLPLKGRIAVICDSGDAASQVVGGLRLIGYDAIAIKTGICGIAQTEGSPDLIDLIKSAGRGVDRKPPEMIWPDPAPAASPFTQPAAGEIIAITRQAVESTGRMPDDGDFAGNMISPAALSHLLGDGELRQDLFLLDLRREEDYEGVGHIPGAVHVDFESALSDEALALLPRDRKIITICYTGNLAAQMTTILNLLDYDSAVLANGMVCWTRTPTAYHYLKDIQGADTQLRIPEN